MKDFLMLLFTLAVVVGLTAWLCALLNKRTGVRNLQLDAPPPPPRSKVEPWLYGYEYEKVGDKWFIILYDIGGLTQMERAVEYGPYQMTAQSLKNYTRNKSLVFVEDSCTRLHVRNFPTPKIIDANA